ncbi:MAG: bifunctional serine/threonine-protein kinase/formylglycine-generating enzyme family protein [Planctomycetota bacterium]
MSSHRHPQSLPHDLEEEVLEILEGSAETRDRNLLALIADHPAHAAALRRWLVAAKVLSPELALELGETRRAERSGEDGRRQHPTGPGDEDALPRRIGGGGNDGGGGDYELVQLLGRGGFGTVYRAQQLQPIRRPVAIKVLNPGMDSREVLARFAAEREALNRLDHPGIARLLDAGTTDRGRPFFVMELVEGTTLVQWCRQHNVPLRSRMQSFLLVCEAMQHAHQNAVLHRDLSSNNVLVANTADASGSDRGNSKIGRPKIIDFGIAKSLADPLLQGGAMTFQGTLMGTPEFMSPEQAAGRRGDIDTRTDVYALGVQLYELLTDQLPIPGVVLRAQGVAGMAKAIANHEPARASDVAPKSRRTQLRGDLDSILRKALQKDRAQRYAGVGELADDLRRHLEDKPVEATAPTTWYRLRKFARRNRGQSAAFAAAFVVLISSLVLTALALLQAEREASLKDQANQALREKADAGFRLLANEERLLRARETEAKLPPPWPQHRESYADWQRDYADVLRAEHVKVEQRLTRLEATRKAAGGRLPDDSDRHLRRALLRLDTELAAFFAPRGTAARVANRRAWSDQNLTGNMAEEHAEVWQRARQAIRASDGERAHRDYRGLYLPILPGLRPLGCHPRTKLWEFLDLRTHAADYPVPIRDTRSGDFVVDAGTGVLFVLVPGGRFAMGARRNQPGMERNDDAALPDELSDAIVTLEAYLIAETELSVAQWARLIGKPLPNVDPQLPVGGIDWQTARTELGRWGLDLPTEAQWERACRAGTTTPWCTPGGPNAAAKFGWFAGQPDADGQPRRVAQKRSNAFGLFDMHGNVAEWCRDAKHPYPDVAPRAGDGLRSRPAPTEDTVETAGPRFDGETQFETWRVVRGGSVHDSANACRSTARNHRPIDARDGAIGLRAIRRMAP